MLVDDHPVVRDGYRRLLERRTGWRVIAEADDAAGAYRAFKEHRPDVVVMDLSMPGAGGLEAVRHILQWERCARILVLTMHASAAIAAKAFEAGALGYATKGSEAPEIVRLVEQVLLGRRAVSADMADAIALAAVEPGLSALEGLAPREVEILRLLADGGTAAEIADSMCLSVKTVHNYHSLLKGKLGARTDADLFRLAMREGLITDEAV